MEGHTVVSSLTIEERLTLIATGDEYSSNEFSADVEKGLTSNPKYLPFVHFYDHTGSQLFEKICELPEYYLTRAETNILEIYADDIVSQFSKEITLVELGSGSAKKTKILIEAFLRGEGLSCYTPIDISRQMLEESSYALLKTYPNLEITAVAAHYDDGLSQLKGTGGKENARLITWLGSSVGNLERSQAAKFLNRIQELTHQQDRLLIGIDLRKDRTLLEKAYDDAQGVTAEFNLNLLIRINQELGGNFNVDNFHHKVKYNENVGRIEMYLTSNCEQQIGIEKLNLDIPFLKNENIHTENSYKYSLEEIDELAQKCGFYIERQCFDSDKQYSLNLFAPIE